ncbi:MAG: tol-pal system protein YbgF [Sterolibacterium sp.]|nr:tol-pal system protein YbgF [Sterolibacterium sp.]
MKRRLCVLLCVAAWQVGWVAAPAHAGLFDDDEARNRIEGLRRDLTEQTKRIDAVNTTATTGTRSQLDLANQIEQIKTEIATLRGQLEVVTFDLETAQKRQKDFYIDLDGRLRKLETAAPESKPDDAASPPAATDPAAEMRDYEAALTLFKGTRYKEAFAAFNGFIITYASSTMLPNAHYWAASALYQLHDFRKAADLFGKVVATWPADVKAPDALLAQANSLRDGWDLKGARKALEQLVEKYPASGAAQVARSRLQKK